MQNIRIIDLNTNDIVKFQITKEYKTSHTGIVTRVYAKNEGMQTKWYADVENVNGKKFTINDNYDFIKVNEPFTRKVDMVHRHHTINSISLTHMPLLKRLEKHINPLQCFIM